MIKIERRRVKRVVQGDIISEVDYIERVSEKSGVIEVHKIRFPLVVVLTQDCDLEQDYRVRFPSVEKPSATQDKYLMSVLVAPLYNVEHVYEGEHLSELQQHMAKINRRATEGRNLTQNERPRYHYIEFPSTVPVVPSVVDFKHYFSVNGEDLRAVKKRKFVCRVSELYREDLCLRFANYLARIGLPDVISPKKPKTAQASG